MSDLPFDLGTLTKKVRPPLAIPNLHLRQAEVTAYDAGTGTCTIKLAASSVELSEISSFIPVVDGDIVWVAEQGTSLIVVDYVETGWHEIGSGGEPAFQNSWVNVGGSYDTAAFCKIGGITFIKGSVKTGTLGTTVFTLPVGYRPLLQRRTAMPLWDGGSHHHGMLFISTAGEIQVNSSTASGAIDEAHLGTCFVAEQ